MYKILRTILSIKIILFFLTQPFRYSPFYLPIPRPCYKHRIATVSVRALQRVLHLCGCPPSCRQGYSSFVECTWSHPPWIIPYVRIIPRGLAFPLVHHLYSSNNHLEFWYAIARTCEKCKENTNTNKCKLHGSYLSIKLTINSRSFPCWDVSCSE